MTSHQELEKISKYPFWDKKKYITLFGPKLTNWIFLKNLIRALTIVDCPSLSIGLNILRFCPKSGKPFFPKISLYGLKSGKRVFVC